MKFDKPLIVGRFVKRYKRFFVDAELSDGTIVTAHCANPGAMTGLLNVGSKVFLLANDNPARKLKYTLEIISENETLVGANTNNPNKIIYQALKAGEIPEFTKYTEVNPEVKYGSNSRIDFLLSGKNLKSHYLEIKNVHWKRGHTAYFPDCVTARGAKHMDELEKVCQNGFSATVLFLIQRNDCIDFKIASDIDISYMQSFHNAIESGVNVLAYDCKLGDESICINKKIPVVL